VFFPFFRCAERAGVPCSILVGRPASIRIAGPRGQHSQTQDGCHGDEEEEESEEGREEGIVEVSKRRRGSPRRTLFLREMLLSTSYQAAGPTSGRFDF
jgi:hypothetical protein